ncbi:hypothetical protein ABE67_14085 [Cytobacillus firmus]|uniref:PspA/IM30 family protein n=1 Tax=Cytobacillus firmus TaxID=1399 RepID=UPI0018CFD202|nr:hypothetical protein [Cytobacillus firmus]MBG9450423.1 hypothetical protein [Cytobacillus firmus]
MKKGGWIAVIVVVLLLGVAGGSIGVAISLYDFVPKNERKQEETALEISEKKGKEYEDKIKKLENLQETNRKTISQKQAEIEKLESRINALEVERNSLPVLSTDTPAEVATPPTESVDVVPEITISAFFVDAPSLDTPAGNKQIAVNVTIANYTSQAIEVKPYTLNLTLNSNGYPQINEKAMHDFEKYGETFPVSGMLVLPNQESYGAVIYEIPEDSVPVSISWDSPLGTVTYTF